MPCFPPAVGEVFKRWEKNDLLDSLEESYQRLLDHRLEVIDFSEPEGPKPKSGLPSNCRLLQQIMLHRAERLLVSSGTMLLENNVYGLSLIVRGHYETTAVLGYFCNRLESLAAGNIDVGAFEWNVADAVMGASHPHFGEAPTPKNILTCIEKADKYLDKHFFKAKKQALSDSYSWLSDFAHPNFLSNLTAFTLDKENLRFVLRHGGDLQEQDLQLMGYLEISAGMFVFLFDAFTERATAAGVMT